MRPYLELCSQLICFVGTFLVSKSANIDMPTIGNGQTNALSEVSYMHLSVRTSSFDGKQLCC